MEGRREVRKEGRKERKKEGRKEGRKKGRKEEKCVRTNLTARKIQTTAITAIINFNIHFTDNPGSFLWSYAESRLFAKKVSYYLM